MLCAVQKVGNWHYCEGSIKSLSYFMYMLPYSSCNMQPNFVIKLNSAIKGINIRAHTCLYCIGYLVNISSSVFCNSTTFRLLQADSDFYVMAELLKDYIGLIQAVKVSVITSC